jgi:hypothetical protein
MANSQTIKRLVKEVTLMNIMNTEYDDGSITMLIEGVHGNGKSSAIRAVARETGGHCITVEGGVLQQGELTGIPLAVKDSHTGEPIFEFIKHPKLAAIENLEQAIYKKAITEGFLHGAVKLDVERNVIVAKGNEYPCASEAARLLSPGNKYKFGDLLPAAIKLELIESGEIPMVQLFIDELNRAENSTMKEMMNLVLNRNINGYDLPWWVNVVAAVNPASQDIEYAVSELDPAQLDRFMKVRLSVDFKEWVEHSLETGRCADAIAALAADATMFGSSTRFESTENKPSPRSWSQVLGIYEMLPIVMRTKYFSDAERAMIEDDLRTLICAKVGSSAGEAFLTSIKNKDTRVSPAELLTMKEPTCPAGAVSKFKAQNTIARLCTISMIVSWVNEHYEKVTASKEEDAKAKIFNLNAQLKNLVTEIFSGAEQMFLVGKIKNPQFMKESIFQKLSIHIFGKELYAKIMNNRNEIKSLEE